MFLGNQYWLLLRRAGPLLRGHTLDGLSCLHYNLSFICVLSSRDSCHEAEIPSSGLCLDKVNKWFGTLASRVGMSKVTGVRAARSQIRFEDTERSVPPPLFDYVPQNMDKQPEHMSMAGSVLETGRWKHTHRPSRSTFGALRWTFQQAGSVLIETACG